MPIANVKLLMEVLGEWLPEPTLESIAFDEYNHPGGVEVAPSGTETVDFSGPTTVSFIFVRGNRAMTLNFNALGAYTVNAGGWVLLFNVSITSLTVINSDAVNTLNLEIFLGGT